MVVCVQDNDRVVRGIFSSYQVAERYVEFLIDQNGYGNEDDYYITLWTIDNGEQF